jgi:peptidyl-prolyl cis-trans isomerase SurA
MTFFKFPQSATLLILSASLSALPSLAQSTTQTANAQTPPNPAALAPVNGKVVEDIVARVNDQIITQTDYDRAAEQLDQESKQQAVPPRELQQKQADLLRDLIDKQLLLSKGKELGITGETELIKSLDNLRKQYHLDSLEDLEKAAQQQGISYEDFKANIRDGIITQQVVRDEVGRHINISPADVQSYFKQHESEFAQPESVTLNEILVPTPGGEGADAAQVAAAQAQAEAIEAKLAAGAKFEDLAKPAPTDPTAPKSVTLGEFRRGMLGAKEIEDKAFALNAGQYTQPIRTKQGFIILQASQRQLGGDASFKQVEPQVEEALFLERMEPSLRQYLTKLREEAYVELKPGAVDTGASGNEMRLTYSAYTPPPPKKKKKFARAQSRGRSTSAPAAAQTAPPQTTGATTAAGGTAPTGASPAAAAAATAPTGASPAATAAATAPTGASPAASGAATAPTQQASNNDQNVQKPGKKEKIRFGQAPRESLPSSQVATANTPAVGPETRVVNPDGTVSSTAAPATERKSRLSNRAPVKKVKKDKSDSPDAPPAATPEEQASQKVQDAPLGLADPTAAQKKAKPKGEKTRFADKPKEPDQTPAPYLGKPADTNSQPAGSDATHPAPAANPPAPASSEPAPATAPPGATPPAGQQP